MKIAVIGAGSWGTAIAHLLGEKGVDVQFWAYRQAVADAINETHHNPRFLIDVELAPSVVATSSYEEAVAGVEGVVLVTPSSAVRTTAENLAPHLPADVPVCVLSKGIEGHTGFTMVDILADVLGGRERLAALCGPNHAEEVSKKLPAATVVASESDSCAAFFQEVFSSEYFRVYTSSDVLGVELCSAAKNIYAIANGMLHAMGLGDNASATLITRASAEMARLVHGLGGDFRTVMGLAGMGDLIATCTSVHSRNRTLGEMLVAGQTLADFEAKTHMVAEGAVACRTVVELAESHGIELPIACKVRAVLMDGLDPHLVASSLMSRPQGSEFRALGFEEPLTPEEA